jgi:hypothetical protein
MKLALKDIVPAPIYPDPESLPLPKDKYEYVQYLRPRQINQEDKK